MKLSRTAWIVIALVGVSAISVGGYFIVKKSKEDKEKANKAFMSEIDRLNAEKALSKGFYADLDEKKENEKIKSEGLTFR
jgi:hypothetical protein